MMIMLCHKEATNFLFSPRDPDEKEKLISRELERKTVKMFIMIYFSPVYIHPRSVV